MSLLIISLSSLTPEFTYKSSSGIVNVVGFTNLYLAFIIVRFKDMKSFKS